MNQGLEHNVLDGYIPSNYDAGSYESSIASSAHSSQTSVFSDASTSSSIASSVSDDFRTQEDTRERDRACFQALLRAQVQANYHHAGGNFAHVKSSNGNNQWPSYADFTSVPAPQRQHPRRGSSSRSQRPPALVRQRDRKHNFVDNLVDSATQMVEVIWPLSVVACGADSGGRGVLPLRTYIEETLRRSRTSYSTLQVALYYLILIRPHVPASDFTMEQIVDSPGERALMCGRRMFLAALILASKYLQDRNYSAKAWSKMSGLKVCEINLHERIFLEKINWKLHISKPAFERWQDVVLRYTPQPPSPGWNMATTVSAWKRIIPWLTPDLDNLPRPEKDGLDHGERMVWCDLAAPVTPTLAMQPQKSIQFSSASQESTPTPLPAPPPFLEPNLNICPPLPPRMGPLPTPSMTPSSVASSTPAASTADLRRPSMCSAMSLAHKANMDRCTLDAAAYPFPSIETRPALTRRSSILSVSSPESMMSDNSRSSRASSLSSVSTASTNSSLAPRAWLRQATCRNAGLLPSKLVREEPEGTAEKPIIIDGEVEMVSSPVTADFCVSEKAMHAPHRHSRHSKHSSNTASTASSGGKKRARPHGSRRSELQEEVRYLLEESYQDSMELDHHSMSSSPPETYGVGLLGEKQPPSFCQRSTYRGPVQKKRACNSGNAMSISPVPLYGEVM